MPRISPNVLALKDYKPADRDPLMKLRAAYFAALPEVCAERPRLVTEFHFTKGLLNGKPISFLDKARAYKYALETRKAIVRHTKAMTKSPSGKIIPLTPFQDCSPFAGSTTSKFKGVIVYPELIGLMLWPELSVLPRRKRNPYHIEKEDVEELSLRVFPKWMDHSVLEIARRRTYEPSANGGKQSSLEIRLLQQISFYLTAKALCISHTIPDFSAALNKGLRGMIEDAEDRRSQASDPSKRQFYSAVITALEGIIAYSRNLAGEAERLARKTTDWKERDRLQEIARRYRTVPEFPATTFCEALTTIWICWIAIHLENPNVGLSLGRLDQILYRFYRKDVHYGILDAKKATELMCYFWLKIGDHVPTMTDTPEQLFGGTGANQAITIGGVKKSGKDAVNDMTYVILRSIEIMKLRDPNLNARYHLKENPSEYLRRLCETNISTGATPAIHNDQAIIAALKKRGHTLQQARDYGIVGCVEPGSCGRSYGHHAAILLNLPSVLELALYDGKHRRTGSTKLGPNTGNPANFTDFSQFKNAFKRQLKWLAERAMELNDVLGRVHQDYYPTPILSSFFQGPMDKGLDLIRGGALVNSSGVAVIGLADVADSLAAIRHLSYPVAGEPTVPIQTFIKAIDKNFGPGYGKVLAAAKTSPKYGNQNPKTDELVAWLVESVDEAFGSRTTYRGGKYRVAYWTMTLHAGLGKITGALPSGRRAGESFASGITPVSGVAPQLPAALNSAACLPAERLSGGVAFNVKFLREPMDKMLEKFIPTVQSFFDTDNGTRDGGMEIQFNVTSREKLEDAKLRPDKYWDLLVRVSGYTAYFKDLTPEMQDEIINRTEYALSSTHARSARSFSLKSEEP